MRHSAAFPELTTFDDEVNEYPMLVEHTGLFETTVSGDHSDSQLWKCLSRPVMDGTYNGKIDVWYESPAKELIQDPETKAIQGVTVDKSGELVNVFARCLWTWVRCSSWVCASPSRLC